MKFLKLDSTLIAQSGKFRDSCKSLLPLRKEFERINHHFLKISGGIKINHFAQIGFIMEVNFGDNLLQVLFLTLFVLGVWAVHVSNSFDIIGSFVDVDIIVLIINTLFFLG